jgi:hypothetical protein
LSCFQYKDKKLYQKNLQICNTNLNYLFLFMPSNLLSSLIEHLFNQKNNFFLQVQEFLKIAEFQLLVEKMTYRSHDSSVLVSI